ncbi:MAG: DUF1801 domain-containing protein [Candidatus Bipolaricaulia bacterium]
MARIGGRSDLPEFQRFLADLPAKQREVVDALREVVRRVVPDAEETILWGGLSYHSPWVGGRVKGAICQISVKRSGVRLEFIHGVRLADPNGRLEGDRLSKRYVPIRSADDAREAAIARLIREASAVELTP